MHRYFDQVLPGEINGFVKVFIDEDKEGLQGKKWRYSSATYKRELNVYLYKKIRAIFEKNIISV